MRPFRPAPEATQLSFLIHQIASHGAALGGTLRATVHRVNEHAAFSVELFDLHPGTMRPLTSALNYSRRPDPALLRFIARLTVPGVGRRGPPSSSAPSPTVTGSRASCRSCSSPTPAPPGCAPASAWPALSPLEHSAYGQFARAATELSAMLLAAEATPGEAKAD